MLLETVALGAHEDRSLAGLGRAPEDGNPAWCEQQELLAHGENPGIASQAMSNAWLKAQGLVSVKDLWCKAQGYTNSTSSSEPTWLFRPLRTRTVGGVGAGG